MGPYAVIQAPAPSPSSEKLSKNSSEISSKNPSAAASEALFSALNAAVGSNLPKAADGSGPFGSDSPADFSVGTVFPVSGFRVRTALSEVFAARESPSAAATDAAAIIAQPTPNVHVQPTFPAVKENSTPANDSKLSKIAVREGETRL